MTDWAVQEEPGLNDRQKKEIRAIVREEIVAAFQTLGRSADGLDGYDTAELDSRALSNITEAAEDVVRRLTCPHEKYWEWAGQSRCECCGEPEKTPDDPFKESND